MGLCYHRSEWCQDPVWGVSGGFPEEVILSEPEGQAGVDEMKGKENISGRGNSKGPDLGREEASVAGAEEVEHGRG